MSDSYKRIAVWYPDTQRYVSTAEHEYLVLIRDGLWDKGVYRVPKGYHVHHKDFDQTNNNLSNLVMLTASEHQKIHWAGDEPRRQAAAARMRARFAKMSPEERAANSAAANRKSVANRLNGVISDAQKAAAANLHLYAYKNKSRSEVSLANAKRSIFHIFRDGKEILTLEGWRITSETLGVSATALRRLIKKGVSSHPKLQRLTIQLET